MRQQHQLVPHFVLERMTAGVQNGRFTAACLFIDSSGFTPLTSALMAHGPVGAELIADALKTIFGPLVQMVHEQGGFIAGFAGDAIKAVFPVGDADETAVCRRVLRVARQSRAYVLANATQKTDYGDFDLVVKASIGLGEVAWEMWQTERPLADGVEAQQAACTFTGEALTHCLDADAYAQAGDILLTAAVYAAVGHEHVDVEPVADYFRLLPMEEVSLFAPTQDAQPAVANLQSLFFPQSLLEMPIQGEFRQVVTMFVNLKALPSGVETDRFFDRCFQLLAQYQGYLCRVGQIGDKDKGTTLLLFWGAPRGHENDPVRALNFALALQAVAPTPLRAGISTGMAFAGFVGGAAREEYTCYGAAVTLAARQMVSADWDDIWLDEETARLVAAQFRLTEVGKRPFKGYAQPLPVYRLGGHQAAVVAAFYQGQLVGRQDEMALLQTAVSPIFNGRAAGIAIVQGEAGLGKSRLIHTLEQRWSKAQWALCQTDEILRQSLNPFRYFLRTFFKQDLLASETVNKAQFQGVLDTLLDATQDAELRQELERTAVFLGALLNLYWPDSLYQQLEPELRFGNTLEAVKSFFKALSRQQPLVIHLEDAQWLDGDSHKLLAKLLHNIADYPIALVVSTRETLALDDVLTPETRQVLILLEPLQDEEVGQFAADFFGETADLSLVRMLQDRTDGNPFFMEQMLLYWRENKLVESTRQGMMLIKQDKTVPADVRSILIARIDSLLQAVKQVVLTAAILGREFEMQVLTEMLRADTHLSEKVYQAEQAAIWRPLSELRYLFRHALLRDAAYEMQLRSQRRSLHELAAEAIEQFHQTNLTSHYVDLAYHCDQAGLPMSAVSWYQLAGESAAEQFANEEAISHFSRALELVPADALDQRFTLLCSRERVYNYSGQRDEQKQDIDALVQLTEALGPAEARKLIEVKLREANFAELMADYEMMKQKSEEVIQLAEAGDYPRLAADGYHHLGAALWPLQNYQATVMNLQKGLAIARSEGDTYVEADILNTLGTYAQKHGDSKASVAYHQESRDLFWKLSHLSKYSAATNNLGIALMNLGEVMQAQRYYQEAYEIYRQIGNRPYISVTMGNLGIIAMMHGHYEQAVERFQLVLAEFIETKERWAAALAYLYLGQATLALGNFAAATDYAELALNDFRAIKHRPSEGLALLLQATISMHLGRYQIVGGLLEQARGIYEQTESPRNLGRVEILSGWLSWRQGALPEAETHLLQGIALLEEISEQGFLAQATLHLGYVYYGMEEWEQTAVYFEKSAGLRASLGEHHLAMEPQVGQAAVSWRQGDAERAKAQLEPVIEQLLQRPAYGADEASRLYRTAHEILHGLQDDRAETVLQKGRDLWRQRAATIDDAAQREQFLLLFP